MNHETRLPRVFARDVRGSLPTVQLLLRLKVLLGITAGHLVLGLTV